MLPGLCDGLTTKHFAYACCCEVFPDGDGDGEIDVKELDSTIRLYKRKKRAGELKSWHGNLDAQQDPVFPNWLVSRPDFRHVFSRCATEAVSLIPSRMPRVDYACCRALCGNSSPYPLLVKKLQSPMCATLPVTDIRPIRKLRAPFPFSLYVSKTFARRQRYQTLV